MSENKELVQGQESMVERRREIPVVVPRVDIFENEDEILLYADMPGVVKDEVRINVDNGRLELSGIRSGEACGAAKWEEFCDVDFQRVFSVPQTIDVNKVHAELKDGVLQLHLPKSEAAKPRQIEVKVG